MKLQPNPLVPSPALICHWSPTTGPPEMPNRGSKDSAGGRAAGEESNQEPAGSQMWVPNVGLCGSRCEVQYSTSYSTVCTPAVGYLTVTATEECRGGELKQDTAVAGLFRGRDQHLAVRLVVLQSERGSYQISVRGSDCLRRCCTVGCRTSVLRGSEIQIVQPEEPSDLLYVVPHAGPLTGGLSEGGMMGIWPARG